MLQHKRVTIQDVATHVGVSKMTVSNVLSPSQARKRHVSEATRLRVLEAARQMGYRPNALARSLRNRRTNALGLYSGFDYLSPENAFYAAIISGVQRGCDAHCKDLLLHGIFHGRSVEDIYAELTDGLIDGLIVHAPPEDRLTRLLAESAFPAIALVDAVPHLPSVVVDDVTGGHLTAGYLAARGHRRVLYHSSRRPLASVERRRDAFLEAAARLNLEVEVRPVENSPRSVHVSSEEAQWLDRSPDARPTAAVGWCDEAAYDLLDHCHRRGLRVPEDLAVVGFDGTVMPHCLGRRLTTVRAPWVEIGRTAVALLVRRLAGETVPPETVLPVELIAGDTA